MSFTGTVAWAGDEPTPVSGFAIRDRCTGRPLLVSFTAADGRRITAATTRQGMTAHLPFQDPDSLTENSLMVVQAEHHLDLRDQDGGVVHGLYTTARPRYSDVCAGTTFHPRTGVVSPVGS